METDRSFAVLVDGAIIKPKPGFHDSQPVKVYAVTLFLLKKKARTWLKRFPALRPVARWVFHKALEIRLVAVRRTFKDKYGCVYRFHRELLIQKQMAVQGYWEDDTTALIDSRDWSGARVVEVGANFGAHTLPFALHCGRGGGGSVIAVEASEWAASELRHNIQLNELADNVRVIEGFVSSGAHTRDVEFTSFYSDLTHLVNTRVETRATTTIDDICTGDDRIDLLKIDTDGYDLDVLLGAERTVRRLKPLLYVEVSRSLAKAHHTPDLLYAWLVAHDYSPMIWDYESRTFEPLSVDVLLERLKVEPAMNILAIHKSQSADSVSR